MERGRGCRPLIFVLVLATASLCWRHSSASRGLQQEELLQRWVKVIYDTLTATCIAPSAQHKQNNIQNPPSAATGGALSCFVFYSLCMRQFKVCLLRMDRSVNNVHKRRCKSSQHRWFAICAAAITQAVVVVTTQQTCDCRCVSTQTNQEFCMNSCVASTYQSFSLFFQWLTCDSFPCNVTSQ